MLNKAKLLLIAAAATSMSFNALSNGLIDDFIDPTPGAICTSVSESSSTGSCAHNSALGEILGGEREIELTWDSFEGSGTAGEAKVTIGQGALNLSNDTGVKSTMVVTYDGTVANPMDEDLTWGGMTDTFAIDLEVLDIVDGFDATITVTDTGGGSFTYVIPAAPSVAPVTAFVPYSNFMGVDFSTVSSLVFTVVSSLPSLDLGVTAIRKVPEPATVAIMGLGLLGLGFMRRRKRS